jgi:tetratricopeptide (TPR) repeat protein
MNRNDAIAAVRSNPRDPAAWARLGTFLAEVGDTEKATECFIRALRIDGSSDEAQSGLAALHRLKRSDIVGQNPRASEHTDLDTREWSPMTHILLASNQLTMDELRAMEAHEVFGVATPAPSARLSWMLLAGFPLLLWGIGAMFYALTPLAESLSETTPAARFLALGSLGTALLVILGVATYGGSRLGGPGRVVVGVAWAVWLLSFGSII